MTPDCGATTRRGETAQSGSAAGISLRHVWKIFGEREREAMAAIAAAAGPAGSPDRRGIAQRFGCVVGVADVDLEVAKGEIFCVMGLSGSGKSTLLRHINLLHRPTAGDILLDGQDVGKFSPAALRALRARRIGMVFQHFALLPHRTVRDNVALPLEIQAASKRTRFDLAETALGRVGLAGWGDRFCHELSGGMQQRVGLARALAADPDILLMDEPFSALDPLIRRQLQDEFVALSTSLGKTVVFITHDLDEAIHIGDRIAIMKDGAVIQVGTPEEIVAAPNHDYVASFVADVSPMRVISARRIMETVEGFTARHPERAGSLGALPRVSASDSVGDLVDASARSDDPLAVTDEGGVIVGVVDRQRLLESLRRVARP